MGHFTLRALTLVRAAKRPETLDTIPMTTATKRWAAPQLPLAPGQNLLEPMTVPLLLGWSRVLEWKTRRCWTILSVTAPLQNVLLLPCTRPKQPAANVTWLVCVCSLAAKEKTLLPHLLPELSLSVISWGMRDQETSCCEEGDVPLLWIYLRILYYFFFFSTWYLFVCVWQCVS